MELYHKMIVIIINCKKKKKKNTDFLSTNLFLRYRHHTSFLSLPCQPDMKQEGLLFELKSELWHNRLKQVKVIQIYFICS